MQCRGILSSPALRPNSECWYYPPGRYWLFEAFLLFAPFALLWSKQVIGELTRFGNSFLSAVT